MGNAYLQDGVTLLGRWVTITWNLNAILLADEFHKTRRAEKSARLDLMKPCNNPLFSLIITKSKLNIHLILT